MTPTRITLLIPALACLAGPALARYLPISGTYGTPESCEDATLSGSAHQPVMEDYTLTLSGQVFMGGGFICPIGGSEMRDGAIRAPVACYTRGPGFNGLIEIVEAADHSAARIKLTEVSRSKSVPPKVVLEETLPKCVD